MLSKLLTRREQWVLLSLAAALLVGSLTLYATRNTESVEVEASLVPHEPRQAKPEQVPREQAPATVELALPAEQPAAAPVPEATVVVSVRGAVVLPGVYDFAPGTRVQEALDRAGGVLESADLSDINLAARLMDGSTLTVPETQATGHRLAAQAQPVRQLNPREYSVLGFQATPNGTSIETPGNAPAPGTAVGGEVINLNTAGETELQTLPGIGPKLAAEIVKHRAETRFSRVEDVLDVNGIGPKKLESIRPFITVQ